MKLQDIPSEQLREDLRNMKQHHVAYKLIKEEMQARGRWKNKPRGKAFVKGDDKRRGIIDPRPKPKFNGLFTNNQ